MPAAASHPSSFVPNSSYVDALTSCAAVCNLLFLQPILVLRLLGICASETLLLGMAVQQSGNQSDNTSPAAHKLPLQHGVCPPLVLSTCASATLIKRQRLG